MGEDFLIADPEDPKKLIPNLSVRIEALFTDRRVRNVVSIREVPAFRSPEKVQPPTIRPKSIVN